jgi:hypothetical protein
MEVVVAKKRKSQIEVAANLFAKQIGRDKVKVDYIPMPWSEPGMCIANVEAAMEQGGGDLQQGWQVIAIMEGPRPLLLVAQHHVVWVAPWGQLADITPWENGNDLSNNGNTITGRPALAVFDNYTWFVPDDIEFIQHPRMTHGLPLPNKMFPVMRGEATNRIVAHLREVEQAVYGRVGETCPS